MEGKNEVKVFDVKCHGWGKEVSGGGGMKWNVYHKGSKVASYPTFDEAAYTMKMICNEVYGDDFPADGELYIEEVAA